MWRGASANADGEFRLAALPAGDYEITIFSGAERVTQKLTLNPRDLARLSVLLRLSSQEAVVSVNDNIRTRIVVELENAPDMMAFGGVGGACPAVSRVARWEASLVASSMGNCACWP